METTNIAYFNSLALSEHYEPSLDKQYISQNLVKGISIINNMVDLGYLATVDGLRYTPSGIKYMLKKHRETLKNYEECKKFVDVSKFNSKFDFEGLLQASKKNGIQFDDILTQFQQTNSMLLDTEL